MRPEPCRPLGRHPLYLVSSILLVAGALAGCGTDLPRQSIAGPSADGTTTNANTVVLTPTSATIAVGQIFQLTATAYSSTGTVLTSTASSFVWSSSNTSVATIGEGGKVTGRGAGTATISATYNGMTGHATITVSGSTSTGTPASVTITPSAVTTAAGTKVQLTATVKDASGNTLSGQPVTWSTSAPTVATVDATGLVSALVAGSATITATDGTVHGQASVTVTTSTAPQGNVVVTTTTRFQTINGWEAVAQAGQGDPKYPLYRSQLLSQAASDLGINRFRVGVRAGAENPTDYWTELKQGKITQSQWQCLQYTVVNDDSDPSHINAAGFHFSELDSTMEQLVLPYRSQLASIGRRLWINLEYVAFGNGCTASPLNPQRSPQEYAEFALAAFTHLQQKYGIVPDSWEMILEPDNGTFFTGNATLIGQALAATAPRLAAAGFHPQFIAPSTEIASNAPPYYDAAQTAAGSAGTIAELSYHRYGTAPSATTLSAIAQRAQSHGIRSSMLEHIGGNYNELLADLTLGRVSAWEQFALAFQGTDDGSKYYVLNTSTSTPTITMGDRTRYLRQFFHYILAGAVRVAASTSLGGLTPVAFLNSSGKGVVVVAAGAATSFTISGLAAGTYGVTYTTAGATGASAGAAQTIAAGQLVKASIPAAGVVTIFQQ